MVRLFKSNTFIEYKESGYPSELDSQKKCDGNLEDVSNSWKRLYDFGRIIMIGIENNSKLYYNLQKKISSLSGATITGKMAKSYVNNRLFTEIIISFKNQWVIQCK